MTALGREVAGYELLRHLGRGGMAEVWLGRERRSGGLAAVKLLPPHASERHRAQFGREARAVAGLSHPHIVPLYQAGDGYLITRFVDGTTLQRRLRAPLSLAELVPLAAGIAGALGHAHAHGVIHCDVKPSNILIDRAGCALLADFGLARFAGEESGEALRGGTPAYMAPEHFAGSPVPASDQYALARTLLVALLGEATPLDSAAALARLPAQARALLGPLLERALARDAAARFSDMAAFAAALPRQASDRCAPVVSLRRDAAPFAWCARPVARTQLGASLFSAEHRLTHLVATGGLPRERVADFQARTGYADLTFTLYASNGRLGAIDDPSAPARAVDLIVLMHGLFASRGMWERVAQSLARDNGAALVLAPDLHGFGGSPLAPDATEVAPAAAVAAVKQWLALLGLEELRTVLVGSCYAAAGLVATRDGELDGVACRVALTPSLPALYARYRRSLRLGAALITALGGLPPVRRILPARLCATRSGRALASPARAALSAAAATVPGPRLARMLRALLATRPAPAEALARLVVVTTEDDPVAPSHDLEAALRAHGLAPRQLYRLAEGGHYPLLPDAEEPGWCARNADELAALIDAAREVTEMQPLDLTAPEPPVSTLSDR